LGRGVEQLKRNVTAVAEEQAEYQCQACDVRFHTEYDECPDCGAGDVSSLTTTE
jgi:rRNA maturation endonuclease Nob1